MQELDAVYEMESRRRKSDSHIIVSDEDPMEKCLSVDSYASSRRRSLPKKLVPSERIDASNDEKRDESTETLAINQESDIPPPVVAV